MDVAAQEVIRSIALVGGLLAWGMAALLLRFSRHRSANAPLIAAFLAEGTMQIVFALPPSDRFPWSPAAQRSIETVAPLAFGVLPWAYLLFLATLDAPLARALRHALARRVFLAAAFTMPVLATLGLVLVGLGSEGAWWEPPYFTVNAIALVLACIAGLVIGIGAARRAAPHSLQRARALAVAWGFGLRDSLIVLGLGLQLLANAGFSALEAYSPAPLAFASLVAVPILGHGVLRAQLFHTEARLRIRRGTIGAVFVALYVVSAQGIASLLAPRYGLTLALTAAALLVLLLVPLQRGAEAIAERAFPASPGPASREPLLLGRLRPVATLGEGSEGRTQLCEDVDLGRRVAVKTIRPARGDREALREARALAAVSHPAVVTIFDVVREGDEVHLVMEHVPGGALSDRLAHGTLPREEFFALSRDLVAGVAALHDAGLVHGDLKPANVLLRADGGAKVADLGIARWIDHDATRIDTTDSPAAGTPRYLAPEQVGGGRATMASDQHAVALVLLEAWTGRPVFPPRAKEAAHELLARIATGAPQDALAELPAALRSALAPALRLAPSERHAHVRDLGAALSRAEAELTHRNR